MIEKIERLTSDRSQNEARDKINELIEASNRQDRAIARLTGQHFRNGITQQMSNDLAYFAEVGKEISTGVGT